MSDYIYAGSRIKTLHNKLLDQNQTEILLSAKTYGEALGNLQDTFMGSYLAQYSDEKIPRILEIVVTDAKNTLTSMAPEPELLNILWLKYDFYNLSAIIKASKKSMEPEEIESLCFNSGAYSPAKLIEAYNNKTLNRYDHLFKKSAEDASSVNDISEIDRIMNMAYLKKAKEIAIESKNAFLKEYVKLIIDFFNIQANLRALSYGQKGDAPRPIFVYGGSIPRSATENKDSLLSSLPKIGASKDWEDAIKDYKETGSYSLIEKAFDDKIESYVRETSTADIFSVASFYAYFQAVKNNVQIIRTVLVGKSSGLPEHELRKTIRNRYGQR
ncbi:MAG: V-type ATPase subunit [Patescibacteria group bacterium]